MTSVAQPQCAHTSMHGKSMSASAWFHIQL